MATKPIRDRIKELRRVPASSLIPNPKNWRRHPESQAEILADILDEIGYADALIVRETRQGLQIIDGHLRAGISGDTIVPVLVLDVSAREAEKILATLDPLAALAETDSEALTALVSKIESDSERVQEWLASLVTTPPVEPEAPGDFPDHSGGVDVDYCCPRCHYGWSGSPKPSGKDFDG